MEPIGKQMESVGDKVENCDEESPFKPDFLILSTWHYKGCEEGHGRRASESCERYRQSGEDPNECQDLCKCLGSFINLLFR